MGVVLFCILFVLFSTNCITVSDAAITPQDPQSRSTRNKGAIHEETNSNFMEETTSYIPPSTDILVEWQNHMIQALPSAKTFGNTKSSSEHNSLSNHFAGLDLEIVSDRDRTSSTKNVDSDIDRDTRAASTRYDLMDLKERCPYANICSIKSQARPSKASYSCCLPCSCDQACETIGNCCNRSETKSTMCHLPYAKPDEETTLDNLEYFMVDTCPQSKTDIVFDCKTEEEYPWGSMYPVYDSSSDLNFYNRRCAECNGVKNYTYWDLKLESISYDYSRMIPISTLFRNHHTKGKIGFIPPKLMDIEKHACSNHLIKRCNVTGVWKIYDAELEQACHRWFSPVFDIVTGILMYAPC